MIPREIVPNASDKEVFPISSIANNSRDRYSEREREGHGSRARERSAEG